MNKITVKNSGYIFVENRIKDGKGMRNTKEFLNEFVINFAKENRNFFDYFNDLAYRYREKQLNSVIVPAIYKITNNIFTEIPTYRKNKKNLGWIDYGTYYGNTLILIELKHSYIAVNNDKLRETSLSEWKTSIEQIESLVDVDNLKLAKKDNIVKMALNVVTAYTSSDISKDIDEVKENLKETLEKNDLDYDFIFSWEVHQDLLIECEYENGNEIYPYVYIVGKVIN